MIIEKKSLCEGVSLASYKTEKFKSSMMTVSFAMPLDAETASGFSLLTNLMSLSTGKYPTMQSFSIRKDELYALGLDAFVQRRGELILVTLELNMIGNSFAFDGDDVLSDAMELLGDAIFNPNLVSLEFPSDSVATEKLCLIDEIESAIESKPSYALLRARKLMCEGEPFAVDVAGEVDRVKELDGRTLVEFYKKAVFESPVYITYAGEEDIKRVEECVRMHLPFLPRESTLPKPVLHRHSGEVKRICERLEMEQSVLVLGFTLDFASDTKKRAILTVFDEIFGGSSSSKLFTNVREKEGLCYFCSSMPASDKNVLFVSCGLETGSEADARDAILREVDAMKRGDFSDTDLENAKNSIYRGLESVETSLSSITGFLLGRIIRSDAPDLETLIALVSEVTREEVVALANTLELELEYTLTSEE